MARTSAGSVLRKWGKAVSDERDVRLSLSYLRGRLLGRQFDERAHGGYWAAPHPAACAHSPAFQLGRDEDNFPMGGIRPPDEQSWTKRRAGPAPNFKHWDHTWNHRPGLMSPRFMLHPMGVSSCRGMSSVGPERDAATGGPPAAPVPPSDGVGGAGESAKQWAEAAYNGILESSKSVQDAVEVAAPPIRRILEAYPVLAELSIPVTIFTGAWVILPRFLRRVHKYAEQASDARLRDGMQATLEEVRHLQSVPYHLSVWKAMEDPARLFATLLTALQIGLIVRPDPLVAQYLAQFWSGGSVICVVWFLHRWKTSAISGRLLSGQKVSLDQREGYLQFDKLSSYVLLFLGSLGVAEAVGVSPSSLLTVGGIGGIVAAFAAREILSNLLTGLSLAFTRPFAEGDMIKAGAVEGRVMEVGMLSTRVLNVEKSPMIVPNGFFTSQAIVNKSQSPWRAVALKIPVRLTDFERIPKITLEIREMLYREPAVHMAEDKPTCHVAQFSPSALEIAVACNIKTMGKDEFVLVQQRILLEAARIITSCGATLGGG